jgi:hypothetical protein
VRAAGVNEDKPLIGVEEGITRTRRSGGLGVRRELSGRAVLIIGSVLLLLLLTGCGGGEDTNDSASVNGPAPPPDQLNHYIGTQTSTDIWTLTLDHTLHTFILSSSANAVNRSGSFVGLSNGLVKITDMSGLVGYGVEVQGAAVLLRPSTEDDQIVFFVSQDGCPHLTSTASFNGITLLGSTSTQGSPAYGTLSLTQNGAAFNAAINNFDIGGKPLPGRQLVSGACNSTNNTVSFPTGQQNAFVNLADSLSGIFFVADPSGNSSVGVLPPGKAIDPSLVTMGSYLGIVYDPGGAKPTQIVGFGPGSASSITGGAFDAIDTDPFNAHLNNLTITFGAQSTNGLFTGGTIADSVTNYSFAPLVTVVGLSSAGKVDTLILGISFDFKSNTPVLIFLAGR